MAKKHIIERDPLQRLMSFKMPVLLCHRIYSAELHLSELSAPYPISDKIRQVDLNSPVSSNPYDVAGTELKMTDVNCCKDSRPYTLPAEST